MPRHKRIERLILALAALVAASTAHAAVYDIMCMKTNSPPNSRGSTYSVLFDDVNRILIVRTETRLVPFSIHEIFRRDGFIEASGAKQTPGLTYTARFATPDSAVEQLFGSFDTRTGAQVIDHCIASEATE